jgi:hypothetical protein
MVLSGRISAPQATQENEQVRECCQRNQGELMLKYPNNPRKMQQKRAN